MNSALAILVAILGLAVLMVVHEGGHHLVARAFKLRVLRFSIGFGPALWRHQPRGSDTVYQVALIPFLAYVQVAGMNPFEESDPNDKGSYANASLTARIMTVFAGPLANYLFAMGLFLFAFVTFGNPVLTTEVEVMPDTPAAAAQMRSGDVVVKIDGADVKDFGAMREIIMESPGKPLRVGVLREGQPVELTVTPEGKGEGGSGLIGVRPERAYEAMTFSEALTASVTHPAIVVRDLVVGLVHLITQKEKPQVGGPVIIVKYGAEMVQAGTYDILYFLAKLSAYLGGFNLLPVPALDGGRLMFLLYEAVARRKPNARMEAQIHAVGLLMFLALLAVVTVQDFQR
jgi:regulator of sigma E protease